MRKYTQQVRDIMGEEIDSCHGKNSLETNANLRKTLRNVLDDNPTINEITAIASRKVRWSGGSNGDIWAWLLYAGTHVNPLGRPAITLTRNDAQRLNIL